jgi:hypothetical protein
MNKAQPPPIAINVLGSEGTEFPFLKRRLVKLRDGIMVAPVEKVLACFEKFFGTIRVQKVPCDAGIQQQDMSKELGQSGNSCYRGIMLTVKELAKSMSKLTLCSLQRLRKLIVYLRYNGDIGMKICNGRVQKKGVCESKLILEIFIDADRSSNKAHKKSTSCADIGVSFVHRQGNKK